MSPADHNHLLKNPSRRPDFTTGISSRVRNFYSLEKKNLGKVSHKVGDSSYVFADVKVTQG